MLISTRLLPARLVNQARRSISSVSADEIAHFSALSSQWWNENGEFGLLHRMNPARIQFARDRITQAYDAPDYPDNDSSWLAGKQVLDVGCGGGIFAEALARLGANTTGVDASSSNIKIAQTHAAIDPLFSRISPTGKQQLQYIHGTAEQLVAEGRQFDVVCAMEVVEHVNDPQEFLRSLAALTKPGGHLLLSTISRTPIADLLTIKIAESPIPFLNLVSPGTHTYKKYIKPKELADFFRSDLNWGVAPDNIAPRDLLETRGVAYLPWTGKWRLFASEGPDGGWGSMINYFFGARKPY